MTRPVRLNEIVLLACQFEVVGEPAERAALASPSGDGPEGSEAEETPQPTDRAMSEGSPGEESAGDDGVFRDGLEVEGARLEYAVSIQGEEPDTEFVLIVRTILEEPALPYELELLMGATYDTPEPAVTQDEVASTLLFMVYPYIREMVFSITGRSPYRAFQLPPFARLPHPRVSGAEDQQSSTPLE